MVAEHQAARSDQHAKDVNDAREREREGKTKQKKSNQYEVAFITQCRQLQIELSKLGKSFYHIHTCRHTYPFIHTHLPPVQSFTAVKYFSSIFNLHTFIHKHMMHLWMHSVVNSGYLVEI